MFGSIVEDIKSQFKMGNMITRLIILNVGIWAVMALIKSFTPADSTFYQSLVNALAIPGEPLKLLFRPWTIVTHLFVHGGFWHVFWNMIILYWFGRIVGDLVGDRHILPLFFAGGFAGGLAYFLSYQLMPGIGSYAIGASAAVMALVMAAGRLAPDYIMHLILIGPVKLKFIVLALIFFDILGAGGSNNTGGHIAHLAGIGMGWLFVAQMGSRGSISDRFNGMFNWLGRLFGGSQPRQRPQRSPLTVKYKSDQLSSKSIEEPSIEEQVDAILEKIKKSGFESLTKKEREILAKASKE